ncbi:cytochrome c biogenesis protein CcsA [Flavobacteriaceae bacterium]|nr:cytochrome c biogenesis protein CcsA [Flavobacteriaceae bacterium]MDB9794135.1 cytochrome c biogenesis protein CcsA [Flavobacteriaceae bacterium]MDB9976467.1 cytochrome c biogenesis protein CcsA [Flavobacteriaceae bacterium]
MGEKLISFLVSTRLTAILFIVFALAMAIGTFIENDYGTVTAKILIYNATWFELILGVFVLNFLFNIKRYNLLKFNKWPVLMLHLSWILIILGAFVTRYIGYEGVMPIRENTSSNTFLSEKTYLTVLVDGEHQGQPARKTIQDDLLLSEHTNNYFELNYEFSGQDFTIEYLDFIEDATEGLVEASTGEKYLKIVEASKGNRHEHYLRSGEVTSIHNILFSLNSPTEGAINITENEGELFISSPFDGDFMRMADQFQGTLNKNENQPLLLRSLYNSAGLQFVFPDHVVEGKFEIVKSEDITQQDGLFVKISSENESKTLGLLGAKGIANDPKKISLAGLDFQLTYGSLENKLPFEIKLNDFIAEKYPGTEKSYSSFMSRVTVIDDETFDYDIYMNHILNHSGYRFFQASFDPDEKGTVLSVNHDYFGTLITYIGYFLLYIGLLGIMFFGKTRFKDLAKQLEKVKIKKQNLTLILILFSGLVYSQDSHDHQEKINLKQLDSIIINNPVDELHALKFGSLVIQDSGGRMKPLNTFASELLRKVSSSDSYKNLNADQVLLSITKDPLLWYNVPIIYLKRGNDSIRKIAGRNSKDKYAAFTDFFDKNGNYKLASQLESSYKSSLPNQFEKDFIDVDRKINLLFSALDGKILKIFPIPNDVGNKWVSFSEINTTDFKGIDSLYVKNILPLYLGSIKNDIVTNDYTNSTKILESIKGFQNKYGSSILPDENKIKAEILYNKYDIFKKLFSWYMYVGTLMFAFLIFQIFYDNKFVNYLVSISKFLIVFLFILHTLGLVARGFIAGHAPWSDAYESMIFVAWATVGIGLAFGRKSDLTIAATSFVASMILMIAHWSWMDPEIANLVPVLDSYWLMIHVSVIVGSYGPLTLGMILGIVSLFLILITNEKNKKKIGLNLKELTIINELTITVGLIMLTIGNFLGGQWANESWGRYWGWDPKETWALISIMIYAFILHMRLIPGLRSKWIFNLMSIIAYASILMTYFGVNFYLSGLHSYASGDKVITPDFVYYSSVFVFVLGFASYFKYKKYFK